MCDLNYPAEYKMEILQMLTHYDAFLDTLVELIRPYALRLQALLEQKAGFWIPLQHIGRSSFTAPPFPAGSAHCPGKRKFPQQAETRIHFR